WTGYARRCSDERAPASEPAGTVAPCLMPARSEASTGMSTSLRQRLDRAVQAARPQAYGRVAGVVGLSLTVVGITARVGDLVRIGDGDAAVLAEVVALDGDRLRCLPLGNVAGIGTGSPALATG